MQATTEAGVRVGAIVIDVNDLAAETEFWTALLGSRGLRQEQGWTDIATLGEGGPVLSLQAVPEIKKRKNRLHIDLMVDDFSATSEAVLARGASAVSALFEAETSPWQVFADPEGNEFCLISETTISED